MVERRKQIEIEEQEIRRKEKELMSTVKLPAEAEAYKVQTIAEGKRQVAVMLCSELPTKNTCSLHSVEKVLYLLQCNVLVSHLCHFSTFWYIHNFTSIHLQI